MDNMDQILLFCAKFLSASVAVPP